jgi:hypothetical protein
MFLNHFINCNFPFCYLIEILSSQVGLYNLGFTRIESLVTPGRIRSSRAGVTISILPLSLKTKKMFDDPT